MAKKKVSKKKVAKKVAAQPSFVFIGNGENDPDTCVFRGYRFKLNGKAVGIKDPAVAAKLGNNSHFKAV